MRTAALTDLLTAQNKNLFETAFAGLTKGDRRQCDTLPRW
jgi:hypothetical protein